MDDKIQQKINVAKSAAAKAHVGSSLSIAAKSSGSVLSSFAKKGRV
jgi:hypothetical protein